MVNIRLFYFICWAAPLTPKVGGAVSCFVSLADNPFLLLFLLLWSCGFVLFFLPILITKRQPESLSSASGAGAQGPEETQRLLGSGGAGPIPLANRFGRWRLDVSESVRNTVLWLDSLLVIISSRYMFFSGVRVVCFAADSRG